MPAWPTSPSLGWPTRIPGGDLLFSDVGFRVAPGHHVGLVGANGVGKSTLLRILAGALSADEGEAAVGGRIAYMPQDVGVARDAARSASCCCPSRPGPAAGR